MKTLSFKTVIAAMIFGGAVVNFSSCDDSEVMNTLKEMQKTDLRSQENITELQNLLYKTQAKLEETEQELKKVKQNQDGNSYETGGNTSVDFSDFENEISKINTKIEGWKKLLQTKIDSLGGKIPSIAGLAKTEDIPSLEEFAKKSDISSLKELPTVQEIEEIKETLKELRWLINANGYEYVDLGLSVLWATCNVGAESPDSVGKYFAWGETNGFAKGENRTFNWNNYFDALDKIGESFRIYNINSKKELLVEHDAATVNWGGKWRMPSYDECAELRTNCDLIKKTNGYELKSKKNGNVIFIPNGKHRSNLAISEGNIYWSRSLSDDDCDRAKAMYIDDKITINGTLRSLGCCIRPVLPKN